MNLKIVMLIFSYYISIGQDRGYVMEHPLFPTSVLGANGDKFRWEKCFQIPIFTRIALHFLNEIVNSFLLLFMHFFADIYRSDTHEQTQLKLLD